MGVEFELPRGYATRNGDGDTLVVHKNVEMREMTGEEEDILGQRKLPMMKRMHRVLVACTVRVGDLDSKDEIDKAIRAFTIGDRVRMLLGLRTASLGADYSFEVTCPGCDNRFHASVDLDSLEITAGGEPEQTQFEVQLPSSGKTVRFHPMTGLDEEKISSNVRLARESALSAALMARLDTIDDVPPELGDVKRLSMRDRNFLRRRFEEIEGGVDTDIEIDCPRCQTEFKTMVDIGQPSFFFPKE